MNAKIAIASGRELVRKKDRSLAENGGYMVFMGLLFVCSDEICKKTTNKVNISPNVLMN